MIAHLRRMRRRPAANLTLVRSYLDNTTLHGLHYIGQTALSLAERLFFASAFAFVCLCAAYFIAIIYDKWSDSPVIMTLSDRTTAIASIPFPAVTICNMNQARRSVVETFANGSDDAHLLRAVCRRDPKMANSGTALANQTGWSIFRRFLMRVSHRCRYMLLYCQFGTQTHRCDHLFRTVLTDEGMCCTFNAVDKQFMLWNGDNETDFESIDENDKFFEHPSIFTPIDYTIERGFPTDADPWRTYPRRSLGAGSHLGLTVLAAVHANEYFCSSTNSAGLKMMLHTPNEVPRIADFGFTVNAGRESFVVVQPQIVDASPLIRTLAPDRRQCVFANESPLVYYRTYTLRNCRMECEARLEVLLCGCHQYYMPRVLQTIVVAGVVTEVQICSREEQVCVQEVRMAMASPQNDTYRCDCLPACFEINYGKRLTSTEIGYDFEVQLGQLHQVNRSFMEKNYAVVHVFYKNNRFLGSTMKPFVGFTEFLSNIGGLLGLFIGFSFMSAFELLYYLTIRPICERWRRSKLRPVIDVRKTPATWRQLRRTLKQILRGRLSAKRARWRVIQVYPYTE